MGSCELGVDHGFKLHSCRHNYDYVAITVIAKNCRKNAANIATIAIAMQFWRVPQLQYYSHNCVCRPQFRTMV